MRKLIAIASLVFLVVFLLVAEGQTYKGNHNNRTIRKWVYPSMNSEAGRGKSGSGNENKNRETGSGSKSS